MAETLSAGEILTIRQLAEYLMVSEKTVYRMLDRSELPAVRVGAQWRFAAGHRRVADDRFGESTTRASTTSWMRSRRPRWRFTPACDGEHLACPALALAGGAALVHDS